MFDSRLASLLRVAEEGNFTKAAKQLALTQPAVSQHIRSLENEMGVRIFERSGGKLVITREGSTVLKYVKRILALENNLHRELNNEKLQLASLTIGITHTAESNSIIESLAQYGSRHEGMTLKILTDTVPNLYSMLKNYEIDLAVVEGNINDSTMACRTLDSDSLVLAVSPNHPLKNRSMVTIEELKKERLILRLPNSSTRILFSTSLESRNLSLDDFNVVMELDNIAAIKDLIRHDLGVSVLAKSACLDELGKGKIFVLPIENLGMVREINLVYPKDFGHSDILADIEKSYGEIRDRMRTQPA